MHFPQIPKTPTTTQTTFGPAPEPANPIGLLKQLNIAINTGNQTAIQDCANALITRILSNESERNDFSLVKTIYDTCSELHISCAHAADNFIFTRLIFTLASLLLKQTLEKSDQDLSHFYLQTMLNFGLEPRYTRITCELLEQLQENFSGGQNDSAFCFLLDPIENLKKRLDTEDAAAMRNEVTQPDRRTQPPDAATMVQNMYDSLDDRLKAGDFEMAVKLLELTAETCLHLISIKAVKTFECFFDLIKTGYHIMYASKAPNAQSTAKVFFTCLKGLYENIPPTPDYQDFRQKIGEKFVIMAKMHDASHLLGPITLTEVQQWLDSALTCVTAGQYEQASTMYKKVNEACIRLPPNAPETKTFTDNIKGLLDFHMAIHLSNEDQAAIDAMNGQWMPQKETS